MEAELTEKNHCRWNYDLGDNFYETECRQTFQFSYDRRETDFKYCPYCGEKIIEEAQDER